MIEYKEHRFRPFGSCEMKCRCGFVIWPVETAREAAEAILMLAGRTVWCGNNHHMFYENDGEFTTVVGFRESGEVLPVNDEDLTPAIHPNEQVRLRRERQADGV